MGTAEIIKAEGSCGVSLYQDEVQSVGMGQERQRWKTERSPQGSQEDRTQEEQERTEDDDFPRAGCSCSAMGTQRSHTEVQPLPIT